MSIIKNLKEILFKENNIYQPKYKILFRPDRWNYVKKIHPIEGCVFCNAMKGTPSLETLVIYKTKFSVIVLNKFPYNTGHLLVLPIRHEGDFLSLNHEEYADLHECLKLSVLALKKTYSPHGLNVGLNLDKAAGAGLPDHLHYHIVPRFIGDLNFFPLIAETKIIPETLETSYQKLRTFFEKELL